jgi:hypothetical protein
LILKHFFQIDSIKKKQREKEKLFVQHQLHLLRTAEKEKNSMKEETEVEGCPNVYLTF